MAGAFAAAAAVLFTDPNLSTAAVLSIAGRLPRQVRVIRRDMEVESDVGGSFTRSIATTFEMPQHYCPERPALKTALTVAGEVYEVFDVQADVRKATWILSARTR